MISLRACSIKHFTPVYIQNRSKLHRLGNDSYFQPRLIFARKSGRGGAPYGRKNFCSTAPGSVVLKLSETVSFNLSQSQAELWGQCYKTFLSVIYGFSC
jgi:hypothetical protein